MTYSDSEEKSDPMLVGVRFANLNNIVILSQGQIGLQFPDHTSMWY
jgi:hypothetical protein